MPAPTPGTPSVAPVSPASPISLISPEEDWLRLQAVIEGLRAEVHPGATGRIGRDSSLELELGLDSLARGELLLRIEAAFGVRLPEGTLGRAETPGDLLQALTEGIAPTRSRSRAPPAPLPLPQEAISLPLGATTLTEVLAWHADHCPEREHILFLAAEDQGESLTYRGLLEAARQLGAGLLASGLVPGQTVAIMLPTSLDFFHAFFGTLLAGGVPVPLYPPANPSRLADHLHRQAGILESCQAPLLVTLAEARPLARLVQARVETLRRVMTAAELLALGTGRASAFEAHPAEARDLSLLQYTSGSTGNPKGVALTHANLLANIRAWSRATELTPEDVCVSWLPLYHDMGLIGAWLGSLYNGCQLVLMSPLAFLARPEDWLWAIHRYRGTVTAAPNFAFELCLRRLASAGPEVFAGLDLSAWRLAANGAEPVSPDTLARFGAGFAPYGFRPQALAPVYGLAECAVGLAVPPMGRGPRIDRVERDALALRGEALPAAAEAVHTLAFVACGHALPGHEMRVVSDAGEELPERRVGRLEFRGPSATAGYFRNPEENRRLFHGNWLDTGDLAYLADGEVFITSRVKDLIIRGGRNLYPYELEQAVGGLAGVRRGCVAVFGAFAAASGTERLVAVAETRETAPETRAALEREINRLALEILDTPLDDLVLAPPGTVLKTSSGKLRRAAIRDLYLAGGLGTASPPPWRQFASLLIEGVAAWLGRRWRQAGALAYGGYFWTLVGLFLLPLWPAIAGLQRPAWGWALGHQGARLFLRLAGLQPRISGSGYLPQAGPGVLACNHASYLDGILLLAILSRPAVFIAKRELADQFFAGGLLRGLGAEFVERFEAERSVDDAGRFARGLAAGRCLVYFPEGTFTRETGLRPFHLGAFAAAASNGVPLVPLAIQGMRQVLRDESWLPRPGPISVNIGRALVPSGNSWEAVLRLRDGTRAHILAHCGEPDLEQPAQP